MNWLEKKCEAVRRSTIRRGAVETVSGYAPLALPGSTGERVRMMTVYGKSVQNGTPAPDAPVSVVGVQGKCRSRGKNLLDPKAWATPRTLTGLTIQYIASEDCFVINGTATLTNEYAVKYINIKAVYGQMYAVSSKYVSGTLTRPNGTEPAYAYFAAGDVPNSRTNWRDVSLYPYDNSKFSILNYNYITRFWFYIGAGVSFDNYKVRIQLEQSSTATPYAPFASPSVIAHPTLHGIPLASTATDYTYIDSNGVKYAADTWQWREEGIWEHVQRVGVKVFYGTEALGVYKKYADSFVVVYSASSSGIAICTHMPFSRYSYTLNQTYSILGIDSSMSGFFISFAYADIGATSDMDNAQLISAVRSFLSAQYATVPLTILYLLANPIVNQYPALPWMHTIDASHAGNPLDVAYLDNVDGTTTMPWIQASYYKEVIA